MLDYKVIELSDRIWINELLKKSDFRGCEYNFANNYAWHRLYNTTICRYKDFYISRSKKYGLRYTFPAGDGDYKDLFLTLKKDAEFVLAEGEELIAAYEYCNLHGLWKK